MRKGFKLLFGEQLSGGESITFKEGDRRKIRYNAMGYPYDSNSDTAAINAAKPPPHTVTKPRS